MGLNFFFVSFQINGENVVCASHDRVVNLIRGTGDTLAMKVVTVRAGSRSQDWFNQNSYSSTMPNRKKKGEKIYNNKVLIKSEPKTYPLNQKLEITK